jgi:hypothetical protein
MIMRLFGRWLWWGFLAVLGLLAVEGVKAGDVAAPAEFVA